MKTQSPIAKAGLALTLAATLGVAAAPVAASAQAYGQPYGRANDTPFTCDAPGGKQEGGAIIGALIGGLLGSKVSKHERTAGAVVGAGLGAAAGGYIGCKAQTNDARIDDARAPYAGGYGDRDGYGRPAGYDRPADYGRRDTYVRDGYRLAGDVRPARFQRAGGRFIATTTVNLRAAPDTRSGVVGRLTRGQTFEAMAYTRRGEWVLVSQGGVGVGYVAAAYVRPTGYSRTGW